ncbi:MAG: methylase [Crocinitomicaceae bacterium]|nr:methylase [Crocinitomicaceae bacterium]|tara:strand:- start:19778 stop:20572 length:795 start_codon:yes stop_codon:yes gene_type:complete
MSSFDAAAQNYDSNFSFSAIGKLQRQLVWNYLDISLPKKPLRILELNGGTGEDAIWLAQKGHEVVCTDVSMAMLEVAKSKVSKLQLKGSIDFQVQDVRRLNLMHTAKPYDLVFSNFAGLNCVDHHDLKNALVNVKKLLTPEGRFIAVFLGRFCWWESFYFFLKGRFDQVFRRNSNGPVIADVDGEKVNTWYYSPQEIERITLDIFEPTEIIPIATFIPPSYLESYFQSRAWLLRLFSELDSLIDRLSFASNFSDHYLMDLKVRK